jgi:anaerobic magnesium-protoporphyrin IX monomethyl ester cyclase
MDTVLLVQPNYNIKRDAKIWSVNPPLGLCYLGAVLLKKKINVEILDSNLNNYSVSKTVTLIKKLSPKYVGFSILTPAADWCVEVIRKLPKDIITIAGGPHSSAVPEELIRKGFDIAVIGEGEETLLEITEGHPLEDIKGIYFRKNRKIIKNAIRLPLNINKIPLPARHLIINGGTIKPYMSSGTRYFPWAPIVTSRGCPYNCYFCNKNIFGRSFRTRTPANVIKEIDELVKTYHVKEINFYDDCFNFDIKRAEEILDLLIKRKYNLYLRFSNGIRADKITPRLLHKMKSAGTGYVAYGVESGDPNVLQLIPKGETLAQIEKAVYLTKKEHIEVTGFFIFGLIGDTVSSMENTINFAKKTPFDSVIINIATPYPGTRMWNMIKDGHGKIFLKAWKDFHHVSGKMLYTMPNMATPIEVETMYKKAYRSFYFRPLYLLKQIPKLITPTKIPILFRGLQRILFSQKSE